MKRYRIGLMVGNKSIDYIHAIRMGVQNTLEEAGHTLIAIADLIPFHSRSNTESYFRVAFEVAARLNLDAIIVPAGIIASYLSTEAESLVTLLSILDSNKTVLLERNIPGYRCITKDNVPGMQECMRHLIEDCGFRRIAFISGPETSNGAREREAVYFEEMERHGLDTPPSLFARGEYSGECGTAIEDLIDNNQDLEAIACCVDLIAFSVYNVMKKRRLAVGRDIAVTGFDDHAMSAHLDPPLSTVHSTGYDLGCMGAREAIRICEGKEQEEDTLTSTFIARASCGESEHDRIEQYRILLAKKPFPEDEIIDTICESTLTMAGKRATEDFKRAMRKLLAKVRQAYACYIQDGNDEISLFSSQDLTLLFNQSYSDLFSLEGFQAVVIDLLKALAADSFHVKSDWIIEQISNLHHSIARILNSEIHETKLAMSKREWVAFHITDDAIRESVEPKLVYRLIMEEFHHLGVEQADLYLLPEPVEFIGTRTFALSDTLQPLSHLQHGRISVTEGQDPTHLPKLLDSVIPAHGGSRIYTVGGIMAGNELMGIAALDAGTLDNDGQLIAFLNLGIALKHMQLIAQERESNEILSKSNLLLEQQSHYDEMTGILNRRGFMSKLHRMLNLHQGAKGALFYLDLDGLKYINDTFGHDNGDEAIRQTTHILAACLPPDTILGRLGGDEFVAFTLIDDETEINSMGRSVDAGMATFNATHSYPFDLAISYGGVSMAVDENAFAGVTDTLSLADERLYQMKKLRGRGRTR